MDCNSFVIQQRKSLRICRVVVPYSAVRRVDKFLNLIHLVNHSLEHHPLCLIATGFAHILCNDNRLVGTNDLYLAVAALYGVHCGHIHLQLHIVIESVHLATPLEHHAHSTIAACHLYNVVRLLHPYVLACDRLGITVIGILPHAAGVQYSTHPNLVLRRVLVACHCSNAVLNKDNRPVLPVAIAGYLILGSIDVALLAYDVVVIIIGNGTFAERHEEAPRLKERRKIFARCAACIFVEFQSLTRCVDIARRSIAY